MLDTSTKPKKLRLSTLTAPPSRSSVIAALSRELVTLDEEKTIARVMAKEVGRPLKSTVSLCPECLQHVPALVFTRLGRVILGKHCPTHGASEAVIENDASWYYLSNKDHVGRRFAEDRVWRIPDYVPFTKDDGGEACCAPGESCATGDGTDQLANRTCTVLVEVTDACNLACPVCYSDAKGTRYLPFDDFVRTIRALVEKKGQLDSVQVTGGESLLHPRFWDMVGFLHGEPGVKKVFVPTNGLLFAKEENAALAARYADKLMLLLQFDALSSGANEVLRGASPTKLREKIIARMDALGVPMQLTMTLSQDVNEGEIGQVLDVGLAHDNVKLVAMQPVTWSGRYELGRDPMERLTLSDIANGVMASARAKMGPNDFVPIPCSHPNCGWLTVFLRRFGIVHNVVRYADVQKVTEHAAYKTLLNTSEVRALLGTTDDVGKKITAWLGQRFVRSTDMFSIAIKPFMDRYTYDQDRIANCCHHTTDTHGNLLSFCEYNALGRQQDPWDRLPTRATVT